MTNKYITKYKEPFDKLYEFMVKNGYTVKPVPKIILDNKNQGNNVFVYTGYFDPDNDSIRIFINGRRLVDIMKTFAHELIHYKQRINGTIEESGYSGDKITEDENLIKLEKDAYFNGNKAFIEFLEYEKGKE